jgi:hypothetical protein
VGSFPGVKRPGREADHSPQSTAEIKNAWSYTSTPQYIFMVWCLVKLRDNFTLLYFTIKIISSFLSNRKIRVMVQDETFMPPREIQAELPQGSVLAHTFHSFYINDAPPPQKPQRSTKLSLLMTHGSMSQIVKKALISGSNKAASLRWCHDVSAGA